MLKLPSLGELDAGQGVRLYLYTSPTDMRKGFVGRVRSEKFCEARNSDAAVSTQALAYIRLFYDVDDEAKGLSAPPRVSMAPPKKSGMPERKAGRSGTSNSILQSYKASFQQRHPRMRDHQSDSSPLSP